jgi:hypothetical protein
MTSALYDQVVCNFLRNETVARTMKVTVKLNSEILWAAGEAGGGVTAIPKAAR